MSKQNVYDNAAFFDNFQSSRSNTVNFNHFGHKVRLAPHSCLFYRKTYGIVLTEE